MRNILDFSSWPALLSTMVGLLAATLLMVGVRLVFMQTMQRRRERENRQINERLKTLIAAYKTLGGSFTGQLLVNPAHMRDLHTPADTSDAPAEPLWSTARQRRIRDTVEAALSDVILLDTEEQVQLAAQAAQDMVAGRSIETAQLVVSLRQFIRAALDLEPIPDALPIPSQGPLRPGSSGSSAKRGDTGRGAGADGGRSGGSGGGGAGALAGGAAGVHAATADSPEHGAS
jgi:uncharacterized membrane protein YgcG